MQHLRYLFLYLPFFLYSCQSKPDTPQAPPTDHSHIVDTSTAVEEITDTSDDYSVPDSVVGGNYVVDTTDLPPEPQGRIKILLEGLYHKNEIWKGAENKQWIGLFYNNGKYELRPTKLKVEPAFDPVVDPGVKDAQGNKVISGRQVIGADSSIMLFITGLANLKPGPVDTAAFDRAVIPPTKEAKLSFNGKTYSIRAFGDSTLLEQGEYAYQNYGWKVIGRKNGKRIEQVLSQDESFDKSIYVLYWAGDIDRDGIPDLIAKLSNQQNQNKIALFLSSRAERGKLYKKVAVFESVGNPAQEQTAI